jgi:endoglucanase
LLSGATAQGAHWSGMHSWLSEKDYKGQTNADVFIPANIKDKINNYAINVHQYFDADHSGTNVQCTNLPESKIKDFIHWAQKHDLRFMVTEFGGADAGNCHGMIQEFLNLIHDSKQLLG